MVDPLRDFDPKSIKGQPIVLRDGTPVMLGDVAEAIAESKHSQELTAGLLTLVKQGLGEELQLLVAALTIANTVSIFEEGADVSKLEEVARAYPFSRYLKEMGIGNDQASRRHLINWWESYMFMCGQTGTSHGQINQTGGTTNLWQATAALARKMRDDPARYRFLPAILINHPQEVTRVLNEINDATAFIEVLVGEAIDDLRRSPTFLGAFSTVARRNGTVIRTIPEALYSVHLALKRG